MSFLFSELTLTDNNMTTPETLKKFYEHLDKVQEGMLNDAQKRSIYKNPVTKGELREAILLKN